MRGATVKRCNFCTIINVRLNGGIHCYHGRGSGLKSRVNLLMKKYFERLSCLWRCELLSPIAF